jgi:hypothetical protein
VVVVQRLAGKWLCSRHDTGARLVAYPHLSTAASAAGTAAMHFLGANNAPQPTNDCDALVHALCSIFICTRKLSSSFNYYYD